MIKRSVESIERTIERQLISNKKFIIYPFGEGGKDVKYVLNEIFDVQESFIIDNNVKGANIYPLNYLDEYKLNDDEYILITSYRDDIYDEIRNNIKGKVDEGKIIDLYNLRGRGLYRNYKASLYEHNEDIFKLKRYDIKFYLPFWNTDLIQQDILNYDSYYEEEYLYYITKTFRGGLDLSDKVVLDIGANIGNHSLYFANECNAKKVFAFEPIPQTFKILDKNIQINSFEDRIYAYNCACGDKKCFAKNPNYDLKNIGGTCLEETQEGDINVITIDDLDIQEKIGLIKIDVEGFEKKVILGALKTIEKNKPMIVLESWYQHGNINDIIRILDQYGYKFEEYDEGANYIFWNYRRN